VVGVALVAAGILLVRGLRAGAGAPGRDVVLALGIAASIAAYTLVDREGLRHASPLAYLWLVLAVPSVVYALGIGRVRPAGTLRRALSPTTALAGLGMYAGFALVLTALTMAPPASVSAVRESSVVVAAFLGTAVLRESVGPSRLVGAALVAAGVAFLAVG
jgi:drug/metabolite transporter (DMT)-like permease